MNPHAPSEHDDDRILTAIRYGVEARDVEFKRSAPFSDYRWKIVRTCMAMANLRGGGVIIIGVAQDKDRRYLWEGVKPEHVSTYTQDAVYNIVNHYARPVVSLRVRTIVVDGKQYVGIEVDMFERRPIICGVPTPQEAGKDGVPLGAFVARTRETISTSVVGDPDLVDEIIDIGMEMRAAELIASAQRIGLRMPDDARNAFAREREAFFGEEQ